MEPRIDSAQAMPMHGFMAADGPADDRRGESAESVRAWT
jgi:hypothetical protein